MAESLLPLQPRDALRLMTDVVREYGATYKYQPLGRGACVYVYRSCAHCLVGHVLIRAGVRPATLRHKNHLSLSVIRRWRPQWFAPGTFDILDAAQVVQDAHLPGYTWGFALWQAALSWQAYAAGSGGTVDGAVFGEALRVARLDPEVTRLDDARLSTSGAN